MGSNYKQKKKIKCPNFMLYIVQNARIHNAPETKNPSKKDKMLPRWCESQPMWISNKRVGAILYHKSSGG